MVQSAMTRIRFVALVGGVTIVVPFCLYMIELIVRTKFGSTFESIGLDVIAYSLVAGFLAAIVPVISLWRTKYHRIACIGVAVTVLPLLVWFIWALVTGAITDKSDCVNHFGLLRCVFW